MIAADDPLALKCNARLPNADYVEESRQIS